jgi:hypothetical protein
MYCISNASSVVPSGRGSAEMPTKVVLFGAKKRSTNGSSGPIWPEPVHASVAGTAA